MNTTLSMAPPQRPSGCWVVLRPVGSGDAYREHCGLDARPGHLTCRFHATHEAEAQAMKAASSPMALRAQLVALRERLDYLERQPVQNPASAWTQLRRQASDAVRAQIADIETILARGSPSPV